MFVDSHCHLDRLDLSARNNSLQSVLDAAKDRNVERMLCVAIDLEQFPTMMDCIEGQNHIFASVGVHPLHVNDSPVDSAELLRLAGHKQVVALGETGLDYYYQKDNVEQQQESFIRHLQVSAETRLPVIVHTREAREDTINILRQHADTDVGGVLHCFTESLEMAQQALELNYLISFSGIITFRNAEPLRDVVRNIPLEKMLIETDAPYLTPVPNRGKPNEPQYVVDVAQCIADLKGVRVEEVAEITTANFDRLFAKASV